MTYTYHRLCISLQAYLVERYRFPLVPISFGGTALPRIPPRLHHCQQRALCFLSAGFNG